MSQGAFVTLVGYVAQEPNIRTTKTGDVMHVTKTEKGDGKIVASLNGMDINKDLPNHKNLDYVEEESAKHKRKGEAGDD